MNTMASVDNARFAADMDRAARALRAAVVAARTQGISEDQVREIFEDGIDDVAAYGLTRMANETEARAAALGIFPDSVDHAIVVPHPRAA